MPRIPDDLEPISSGYAYQGPDGAVRSEVSGGMARYALDFDRGVQQFNVTLIMDALQHQVWSYFYHNTIKKGAISFDMPLDSGMGLSDHRVNIFPGSYSVASNGAGIWSVRFVVEAESQAYANPDAGAALIDIYNEYGSGTNALLAALEQFATVDSNVLDF